MTIWRRAALCLPLLLAAAYTPPPPPGFAYSDRAGNRYETLALSGDRAPEAAPEVQSATGCAGDGHCALLRRDGAGGAWRLHLFDRRPAAGAVAATPLPIPASADGDEVLALWPHLVREAGGAMMFGILRTRSTGYSGGGASATRLTLMRFEPRQGMALAETLDVPAAGSANIRACFSRRDQRNRAGACSDLYTFVGDLTLDAANISGRPRFLLTTRARTYPGRRDRDSDSTRTPPLRSRDLTWWSDPICSYRRTFAFDAGQGRYAPDSALPDCGDYLDF